VINVITLGYRQILFIFCFSKVKKIGVLYKHFEFQVGTPGRNWLKFGENVVRTSADKTVLPFLAGSSILFAFLALSSCKKITNACGKNTVLEINV